MANVGFKLGLQSAVDTLISKGAQAGAVPGSFYLTSDTHRLYIGNPDGSVAAVNEGVTTVATLADLPQVSTQNAAAYVGRFYYVSGSNILCVYNGTGWAQINTDTYVKDIEFETTQKETNKEVTVTETLTNWNGSAITHGQPSDAMSFRGENGIHVKAGTDGSGNPRVTIEGDTYTIDTEAGAANEAVLALTSAKETKNKSSVKFKAGNATGEADTNVEIEQDGTSITISAKDTKNKQFEVVPKAEGFDLTIVDNHNADVTGSLNPTVKYGKNGSKTAKYVNGVATLQVYSIDEINETMRTLNAMVYRGTIGDTGTVANKITMNSDSNAQLGCIVYKGTTKVPMSIGDTLLVVGNTVSYNGAPLSANTLLIARSTDGTENASGLIEDAKLIFDVIASTVDRDTTYRIESSVIKDGEQAQILLIDERTSADAGGLSIKTTRSNNANKTTGLKLSRATKDNGANGMIDTWTIEHDNTAFEKTTGTKYSWGAGTVNGVPVQQYSANVVTDIATNAQGHVTGFTVREMPIIDSNSIIESVEHTASHYTTGAGRYVGVQTSKTTEKLNTNNIHETTDNFAFVSDSLAIKKGGNVATASGGSTMASSLQIDLVWGTF